MSDNAELPPQPTESEPMPRSAPVVSPRSQNAAGKPRSLVPAILSAFVLALVIGAGLTVAVVNRFPSLTSNGSVARLTAADTAQPAAPPVVSSPANGLAPDMLADVRQTILTLQARLDTAEARLGATENRTASAQSAAAAISGITSRLGMEDTRLAALEAAITRTAEKDALAAIEQRLGRLEMQDADQTLQRAASVLARANLARAALESQPFGPEFGALMAIAPDDPALPVLQPWAASGVPTLAMLRARFAPNARNALNAERGSGSGGIWARLWASLARLISVRRVGDVSGTGSAAVLARAEASLDRSDLSGALGEVRALSDAAASALTPWLKDAEARLALDRAVADLESRIVQALASQAPAGTR